MAASAGEARVSGVMLGSAIALVIHGVAGAWSAVTCLSVQMAGRRSFEPPKSSAQVA